MLRHTIAAALLLSAAVTAAAGPPDVDISADNIADHIRYLASDELGGRAPGSEGERLTLDYLQKELASCGFAPGNDDGTYLQRVPLVGLTATNSPDLVVEKEAGGETSYYKYGPEFMCWTTRQVASAAMEGVDLVFVGYGVVAPEYDWDDYKDVDVSGKCIVMLVGDPPLPDTTQFGGKAMTYYGRWTYKYEIAAEKGAVGAIIVHDTDAAGYGWGVVENSWTGEQFHIARADKSADRCAIESWVTGDVADEIFASSPHTHAEARRMALSRDFRPFSMGQRVSARVENDMRTLDSYNVVGRLEGNDPEHADECIIYCAHWDHLGVGKPVDGDDIYNGALDNASGVAGILEVARAFGQHRDELSRSVVILFPTAEESGLLGSYYYADHPIYPLTKTVAMINVDGLNVWGPTTDMVVIGYGQSDLDDYLSDALAASGRHIAPDSEPEKGSYYRSDHFAFAKKGVPALYSDSGIDVIGKPDGWGLEQRKIYNRDRYHTPQDEFDTSWNLTGADEDVTALFDVGWRLVTTTAHPVWSATSEFKSVREKSLRQGQR
jgi:Zn-dependent M28 family amino/carboxypeptidase